MRQTLFILNVVFIPMNLMFGLTGHPWNLLFVAISVFGAYVVRPGTE